MIDIDTLMEQVKALPPEKLERVANFVRIVGISDSEILHPAIAATFGTICGEEAEDWLTAMEDCEHINDEPPPRFD